jgi:hypothetical protein
MALESLNTIAPNFFLSISELSTFELSIRISLPNSATMSFNDWLPGSYTPWARRSASSMKKHAM